MVWVTGDEVSGGTDPTNGDTDGDGVSDGDEVDNGTNPTDACAPDPCQNGGVCTQTQDGFICDCTGTGFGRRTL